MKRLADSPDELTMDSQPKKKYTKLYVTNHLKWGEIKVFHPTDKKSDIWKQFGHPQLENGEILKSFAVCKECLMVYKHDSKSGNSHLNQHKCHKSRNSSILMTNFLTKTPSQNTLSTSDKCKLNEAAVTCCASDMRPFSLFARNGLHGYCEGCDGVIFFQIQL